MKFSANTVLFVASSVAFGAVFAKADGGASLRSFPVLEPSGAEDNQSGGIRSLQTACKTSTLICDLDRNKDGLPVNKYAVCVDGKDSLCVEEKYAVTNADLGKKGKVTACDCCAGFDVQDDPFCAPAFQAPTALNNCPGSGCSSKDPNKVPFCFFDASYNYFEGMNRFKECDDPLTYPNYDQGDKFVKCGECPIPPPPTCTLCEGDPEYVFIPTTGSWDFHKLNAQTLGCSLASVTTAADLTALNALLVPLNGYLSGAFVWLGAEYSIGSPTGSTAAYVWADGTPGTIDLSSTVFGGMNVDDGGEYVVYRDGFIGARDGGTYPAVYRCCSELGYKAPANAYASCTTPVQG